MQRRRWSASVVSLWIRSLAAKDDTKGFSPSHWDVAVWLGELWWAVGGSYKVQPQLGLDVSQNWRDQCGHRPGEVWANRENEMELGTQTDEAGQ